MVRERGRSLSDHRIGLGGDIDHGFTLSFCDIGSYTDVFQSGGYDGESYNAT